MKTFDQRKRLVRCGDPRSGSARLHVGVLRRALHYAFTPFKKNVQHLIGHWRKFVTAFGENPVGGHFVERAKQNLRNDLRVQI